MAEAVGKCDTCGIEIDEKGGHLVFPKSTGLTGWNGHLKKDEDGYLHHYKEKQP